MLDDWSAALIHQLVLHGHVFVVATVRAGTPAPDAVTAALAAMDGHRLDRAAGAFDDLGLPIHAAELAGAAARAHRARGRAAAAALSLQHVSALGPDLADARTPLLKINWAERRQGLTRREQEVALMAASGLSSRTIAAKLQLSVRTVSNHLAHIYAKFGVASRAELAALLTPATTDRPA